MITLRNGTQAQVLNSGTSVAHDVYDICERYRAGLRGHCGGEQETEYRSDGAKSSIPHGWDILLRILLCRIFVLAKLLHEVRFRQALKKNSIQELTLAIFGVFTVALPLFSNALRLYGKSLRYFKDG